MYGQQPSLHAIADYPAMTGEKPMTKYSFSAYRQKTDSTSFGLRPRVLPAPVHSRPVVAILQRDLYIKGFGFFCKKEMQIEKYVKLPLRFRLGTLEQCNILEQKY